MGTIPKKRGRPKKPSSLFSITLSLGGATFQSSAPTLEEALIKMPTPQKIVCKGKMLVEGNGKRFERLFNVNQLKRVFWPSSRKIQAKILSLGLK